MNFPKNLTSQAEEILTNLRTKNLKLTFAESCTGGMLSALFTEIAGSSDVFDRGFVTYSNQAKIDMLGVKTETLEKFGAVSAEVAEEMALGAIKNSSADVAIAITGIAGPGGGSEEKPVGLVYIAFYVVGARRAVPALNPRTVTGTAAHVATTESKVIVKKCNFVGNRSEVRKKSVEEAVSMLQKF